MKQIKISLAQETPKLGDKSFNLNLMKKGFLKAKEEQSQIVVFPELFLTGYSVGDEVENLAERIDGPSINAIKQYCKNNSIYTVFGFAEKGDDNQYYISSAIINSFGELLGVYRKTHLFHDEKKYFVAGSQFKVINTSLGKIGLMICFDVEFPEIARALKLMEADLIIIINANMDPYEEFHYIYAKSRAMENEIPVVICNRLGIENDLKFCGDSMVIDALGNEVLNMRKFSGVKTVELDISKSGDPKLSYVINRQNNLYSILSE
ncbi:carbon-nitrogen hydrolase family protein [Virgibacillus sp. W0181]|uniref:carbon-nitrogen hydrolase family protein n=1 Tax=Virgibacillus sp. W0181 TaxID=3391581 RepID=UPI003F4808AD